MEQTIPQNLWALPATIIAIIGIGLTIAGWIVTAIFARINNAKNLKKLEINRLIDELFYKLDFIYNETLELLEDKDKRVSYFLFTSSVRHVEFICDRIQMLDSKRTKDTGFIAELRQACTNDSKYEPDKIGTTLYEIQDVSEKIKNRYIKTF